MRAKLLAIFALTISRLVYNVAVKFLDEYSIFWGVFFFVMFNGFALAFILITRSELWDDWYKKILLVLSLSYILIIAVNIIAFFVCESHDRDCYKGLVNSEYLDLFDSLIIFTGIILIWKGSKHSQKAVR